MKLSNGITAEDVNYYLNFSLENLNSKNAKNKVNSEIDWNLVPSKVLLDYINVAIKKYPDFTKESFNENDFQLISKGLPSIISLTKANEKKDVVLDYFEILVSTEVRLQIKKYLKSNKGGKVSDYYDKLKNGYNNLNPTEKIVADAHPYGAKCAGYAAEQTINLIGSPKDGDLQNSKFHAFWCAGVAKELAHFTGNKWKALDRAKQFTTAHEYDTDGYKYGPLSGHVAQAGVRYYDKISYMDLYNNLVGRTYMYNTMGQTWFGNVNNIPSWANIQNFVNNNCSYTYKSDQASIITINSNFNVETLGNYTSAYDYFTPINGQLVYVNP